MLQDSGLSKQVDDLPGRTPGRRTSVEKYGLQMLRIKGTFWKIPFHATRSDKEGTKLGEAEGNHRGGKKESSLCLV